MSIIEEFLAAIDPGAEVSVQLVKGSGAPRGHPIASKRALYRAPNMATLHFFFVDQICQSEILIDLNADQVEKRQMVEPSYGCAEREVRWLQALEGNHHFPRLLGEKKDTLILSYSGEPARQHNLPEDWQDQAEAILAGLAAANCAHNDIKCDNLTIRGGVITLIDFGFSTQIGQPIPPEWPHQLGRQHRLDIHCFDDRHAIFAALRSAEQGRVDHSRKLG